MTEEFQKLFAQMMEQGQQMARAFNPASETFKAPGFDKIWPTMPADMMEMWFGKTFNRVDGCTVTSHRQSRTRLDGFAVNMHHTCTTLTGITPYVRPRLS